MIRMGGESILSRFANLGKNRFESRHKINENQENRFKSILSMGYRCESIILWPKTKCWPKIINQTPGACCIVLYMYGTVPYRTVNRFFFVTKSIRTVPYRTVPYRTVLSCCTQKNLRTIPYRYRTFTVPCNNYANQTRTVKYGTVPYMYRTHPYRGS